MQKLYRLQNIEMARQALLTKQKTSDEYANLRRLKLDFERKRQDYLTQKPALDKLDARLRALTKKDGELRSKLQKEDGQLYDGSITNAKSLAARQQQIEVLRQKIDDLAAFKDVLQQQRGELVAKADEMLAELVLLQDDFKQRRQAYSLEEAKLKAELDGLDGQLQQVRSQISGDLLAWYQSCKDRFGGTPLAELKDKKYCGGCHTLVPESMVKRLLLSGPQDIVICENCGRRLFV